MQENLQTPRKSRDVLVAHERKVLENSKEAHTLPESWFVIDGDRVVIHWVFEFVSFDGNQTRLEELACQRWRDDRIVEERFYYDPAQLKPQI
jgi:ketosteroid isomerase-like protein